MLTPLRAGFSFFALYALSIGLLAQTAHPAPRIITQNGRHALLVEGAPYLILGAQINNSSSWPATLPQVWPALEALHANTVEAPVYWEQLESTPGHFDFSIVDLLVQQSRQHGLHLVLLWFGTWKNGNMHYVPQWVKTDTATYPRVINAAGEPIDVLSPIARETLEADKHAFVALMRHLAQIDSTDHTVLMLQVENESGIIGSSRDFSAAANRMFEAPVPADLISALHKPQTGAWREVFGSKADETFEAYFQARYINEIAAAGKQAFNIPLYCNVWVSYPIAELAERQIPNPGIGYPSGGPVQDMLPLWKALTPAIDMIGPDIYSEDRAFYTSILNTYNRNDNALWIPETGNGDGYGPYLFLALGRGAIGFSPFGVDRTGWTFQGESGPKAHTENYDLLAPLSRELAQLSFDGKLQTAVDAPGQAEQELDFGPWVASVRFGFPQRDGQHAPGTPDHSGRALVAQLGTDEFLVTGIDSSVAFHIPGRLPGLRMQILSAEEGTYDHGTWHPLRLWNGDQTDRGLNFNRQPYTVVRIKLGRF